MKAFVFDLDGVIRHWNNPDIVGRAEREHGLPDGAIFGAVFDGVLLAQATTGAVTDDEWRAEVVRRLADLYPDADAAGAVAAWSEPFGDLIPGSLEILERARSFGKVCLLSNATSRLSRDLKALGIVDLFDYIFNSFDIGYAKPDHRVYEQVERELGLQGGQIVYVDDSAANVAAASGRGWVSLLASPTNTLANLINPILDERKNLDSTQMVPEPPV